MSLCMVVPNFGTSNLKRGERAEVSSTRDVLCLFAMFTLWRARHTDHGNNTALDLTALLHFYLCM